MMQHRHDGVVARDRSLLRADVEGYSYADILEVRPGRVRLLRPSAAARRTVRLTLLGVTLVWVFLIGPLLAVWLPWLLTPWPPSLVPGWLVYVFAGFSWWVSLIATLVWWDDRLLTVLAKSTQDVTDVMVLEMTSYGTFQELRVSAPQGEMRITVRGTRRKVEGVMKAAGVPATSGA